MVYCGEAWNPNVEPQPFPDQFVIADPSVDGVRGRFGNFSWVGSRGKNAMSFAGCLVADAKLPLGYDGYLQFAHIGIEVPGASGKPYYQSLRMVADPAQAPTPGSQVVARDYAALAVSYVPRLQIKPETSHDDWRVVEMWLFTPQAVIGALEATALKDAPDALPQGLLRLGPLARPHALEGETFRAGNLRGRLLGHNFSRVEMQEGAPDQYYQKKHWEVRFTLQPRSAPVRRGEKFFTIVQFSPDNLSVAPAQVSKKVTLWKRWKCNWAPGAIAWSSTPHRTKRSRARRRFPPIIFRSPPPEGTRL